MSIYLLIPREQHRLNENIQKIGKTKQENLKRFNSYPKGSILLFQMKCYNCDHLERILINIFKQKYEQQLDLGTEYFKGDYHEMTTDIFNIIKNEELKELPNIYH